MYDLFDALKNPDWLDKNLAEADIVTLTLTLSYLTEDNYFLNKIKNYVRGPFDYSAKVPEVLAKQIRKKLISYLNKNISNNKFIHNNINNNYNLIKQIMNVGVGGVVPDEYVPMMCEELSTDKKFSRNYDDFVAKNSDVENFKVIIIGAGLCGLLAAIKLSKANIPFIVIEKNDSVGGTWYENSYPGCGVDTPNHVYSYSFEPSYHWDEFYSKRDSIYQYLLNCEKKYNLKEKIIFNTSVEHMQFNKTQSKWQLHTKTKNKVKTYVANVVISAVGQLNRGVTPKIKGIDKFSGPIVHTASWNHDYDYNNKKLAIIGTGASAMQAAPELAKCAKKLTIFQRTPHWVLANPNYHRKLSEGKKWTLENLPFYSRWYRFQLFWGFSDGIHASLYEDKDWENLPNTINPTNERFRRNIVKYVESVIGDDRELMKKVIPDYPPYGKRMLVDNYWYEMLKKDNVELVSGEIKEVLSNGAIDSLGNKHELDAIICATGFNANKFLWPMKVEGLGSLELNEVWEEDNPKAYLGITVPDFPNLYIMYGPNTNLAHGGSIYFHGECQIRYILGCIKMMIEHKTPALNCKSEVCEEYNNKLDAEHRKMVWSNELVDSWYRNSKGRVVNVSPWRLVDYWNMTNKPNINDFRLGTD